MSIADPGRFLAVARERRQLMMRSRCRITRPNTERTWDPTSGTYDTPETTVVYEGVCQLKARSSSTPARLETAASGELASGGYEVVLPYDVPQVEMTDTVTVIESDDGWIVERALPVAYVERGADNRTHRSVVVLAQDRPQVNDA